MTARRRRGGRLGGDQLKLARRVRLAQRQRHHHPPGVILAEIGDIRRYGSARKLAAWAGLKPTVRGSDRTVRHGHITTQGSTWLRWILCEAAQTAKRSPAGRRELPGDHPSLRTQPPTDREDHHTPGELANPHEPAQPRSMT
jgi:hypothetical protein